MASEQSTWHRLVVEPYIWIFYCLFQPARFKRTTEIPGYFKWSRVRLSLRLIVPVFITSFPFILFVWLLYFPYNRPVVINAAVLFYLVLTIRLLLISAVPILIGSYVLGLARGIVFGWIVNIAYGLFILFHVSYQLNFYLIIIWGALGGFILGMVFGAVEDGANDLICSIVWMAHIYPLTVVGNLIAVGVLSLLFPVNVLLLIAVIILIYIATYVLRTFLKKTFKESVVGKALIWGLVYGVYTFATVPVALVFSSKVTVSSPATALGGIGMFAFIGFICYVVGYLRLLLYPFSALSTMRAYRMSYRRPDYVFLYLSRCSLHWDEYVFLPLPRLRALLLLAAEQDREGTRIVQEIGFIREHRLRQLAAARAACHELALRALEACTSFAQISQVQFQLDSVLLPQAVDPGSRVLFAPFFNMSRDAALYGTATARQLRDAALMGLKQNLQQALTLRTLDSRLNERLRQIALRWQALVEQEEQSLESVVPDTKSISNLYTPGQILGENDQRFVGRQDLMQRIAETLNGGQLHLPLLLYGEHSMGKSSLLHQLPRLLGPRSILVLLDLQTGGMTANVAAFLSTLARRIGGMLHARGFAVSDLEYFPLLEAIRGGEARAYQAFDHWYRQVEYLVAQEGYTVLLALDKFTVLEQARQTGNLNVGFLLDWLQHILQKSSHFALILSDATLLTDLHPDWSKHFVEVQIFKVSFLQPQEARELIKLANTQQEIFPEEVTEELIEVSGRQPFLLHALCSSLIDLLNAEERTRSEVADLSEAIEQVLQTWGNYFLDLWQRCDQLQQRCLRYLQTSGACDPALLAQQTGLDEVTVQRALHNLQQRDLLVCLADGNYSIAVPLFEHWLERSGSGGKL